MRSVIAFFKLFIFLLSGAVTIIYQSTLMVFTTGRVALVYPRAYHAFCTRLLGIKIVTEGQIAQGERIVYVGNHISYLDIPVIGGLMRGSFIAKKEVESWPFFGLMGKMGRTIYISRTPSDAARETKILDDRLAEGLPIIVFPEGTSSAGTSILPFKSSFFEIFLNKDFRIQPFTISVLSVDGRPASADSVRDLYAWHGDMTLLPHLWTFAKGKGAVLKVHFEPPIPSSAYQNRKTLCADVHQGVVKGLDLSASASYGSAEKQTLPH